MARKKSFLSRTTKIMLCTILGIIAMSGAFSAGASSGTAEMSWLLFGSFCAIFIPLSVGSLIYDIRKNLAVKQRQLVNRSQLTTIASKYNQVIDLLEQSYNDEKKTPTDEGLLNFSKKEKLRQHYEELYDKNSKAYNNERKAYLNSTEANPTGTRSFSRYWKWLIAIGVMAQLVTCSYTFGTIEGLSETDDKPTSVTYWNAENIPIPYLTDDTKYVSNPDSVVSENTERLLNLWYKEIEDSLGIQSVVVIVNHVENDDPFRMAQDIGNKYGVGYSDRGLIVILAYEDHAINISPGQSLEGDLTDHECKWLEEEYVVPCMKEEQPDSGMIYLAEAIYCTLKNKDTPPTPTLDFKDDSEGNGLDGIIFLYMILFGGWMILAGYLYNRYVGPQGLNLLHPNPFLKPAETHFVGGPMHSRGSGRSYGNVFGGGSHGGHFGGGSFGGGGATSRW